MTHHTFLLTTTAISVGFMHTLLGPDHYIPFVALSRVRGWSTRRTMIITLLCGLGHIASSVVLGIVGIAFGVLLSRLMEIESYRGDVAAWMLIAFGVTYFAWGLRKAMQEKEHGHRHGTNDDRQATTPWVLFLIFLFGPCEPLIPLMMSAESTFGVLVIVLGFGVTTLATMSTVVYYLHVGSLRISSNAWHRFAHAFAGLAILACGCLVKLGIA